MKRFLSIFAISLIVVCLNENVQAQSYAQGAILFGRNTPGGSARILGMGGAQISLGGDPSLALSNPAGLGMSNRSSFSISGGSFVNNSISSFYGENTPESKFNLNIPQLGIVISTSGNDSGGYKGGSFAVNYTHTNNYHKRINYETSNPNVSIIDYFLDRVDGVVPNSFLEGGSEYNTLLGLGWNSYLIDTIYDANAGQLFYDSYVLDYPNIQGESIDVRGSNAQWSFAYGGNYNDKFFFGVGIGMNSFNYSSEKKYYEYFSNAADINQINLKEELDIYGLGINMSLGFIVRPIEMIQIGINYTSPTYYNVNDEWLASIQTDWNGFVYPSTGEVLTSVDVTNDLIISDYSMTTPGKFGIGSTVFLGKSGFITADFERMDFSKTRLSSNDFSMTPDNQEILDDYSSVVNFRVGGEYRYDIFRARLGAGVYGNPAVNENAEISGMSTVSGGFGIRKKSSFFDLAVVRSNTQETHRPFSITGMENATSDIKNTMIVATVGWNF